MGKHNLIGASMAAFTIWFLLLWVLCFYSSSGNTAAAAVDENESDFVSVLGDPGMKSKRVRVALEAWNFCNEVGQQAPGMGSPRYADCTDYICNDHVLDNSSACISRKVTESDNSLGAGQPFKDTEFNNFDLSNADEYAVHKELYLGKLCQVGGDGYGTDDPWQFWMVMLKNGNFDTESGLCPNNGLKAAPFRAPGKFPCFGRGCMNQPLVYHQPSIIQEGTSDSLTGSFYGTYDLDADISKGFAGTSYFSVKWEKSESGSWVFHHVLKTSKKYPWLMLYLRADATRGFSGGYHHNTRGMMKKLPKSPNFKVRLTLNISKGGGPKSQFYLMDIGSCWKNDGRSCNGDPTTDVTRYSEMIINPDTPNWCRPEFQRNCPPYHVTVSGNKIYRNDTRNFPYAAYHLYCGPGNAQFLEKPTDICDGFSNPQAQELQQLLPHPEWAVHGYPEKKGQGWIGDSRTWELDVGALSNRLYFYQDPGTEPAPRYWTSLDVGTEIYISNEDQVAEWTLSDFDVIVPKAASI